LIWKLVVVAGVNAALAPVVWRWLRRRGTSAFVLVALVVALGLAAGGLWLLFTLAQLSLESHAALLWAYSGVAVGLCAFVASRRLGRMPSRELFVALAIIFEGALVLALTRREGGLASPPFRALLVAPAALPLAGYFGASLGYLSGAAGGDLVPGYEGFIARRFLLSKASSVLSTVTTISVIGVAIGVWLVIVSLAVLSGFEYDLQQKIIGATADVVVQTPRGLPFILSEPERQTIASSSGVVALSPVVEGEAAISSSSNYTGALVFGIEPDEARRVLGVLNQITEGSLAPIASELHAAEKAEAPSEGEFPPPAPLAHAAIGIEMANGLNVGVGDRVRLISPTLETMTPMGPVPKGTSFEVAAIFSSKMYDYDAHYVFISLDAARRFFELAPKELTAVQVASRNPEVAGAIARRLSQKLGSRFAAVDWKSRNQTLFSALELERVVAFVVLVFIILVASFAIVNTLTMAVVEKKKEIAILKTMGARDGGVMKLFLMQGLMVGAFGTLVGLGLALTTVALLQRFGFSIPGDVYYIDSLPVHLEVPDVLVVVLAALLIVWDFAVYPALRGSLSTPVEGLRDG
jgi:lipoprotein releasing system LolC/E family transmembrane protein